MVVRIGVLFHMWDIDRVVVDELLMNRMNIVIVMVR